MGKKLRSAGYYARNAIRQIEVTAFSGRIYTLGEIDDGPALYVKNAKGKTELREWQKSKPAKEKRPLCGARCRSGQPCKARVVVRDDLTLAKRCRMHGGLSTGPKNKPSRNTYTPERGAVIVRAIATHRRITIKQICKVGGIAPATFYSWQRLYPEFEKAVGVAYRMRVGRQ